MQKTCSNGDIIIVKSWGKQKIKNNDIVVFHFPNSDTVYKNKPEINFYESLGRKKRAFAFFDTTEFGSLIYLPVTKRQPYIKRCVALPGDTFEMRNWQPFINGQPLPNSGTVILHKAGWKLKSYAELECRRHPKLMENNPKYWPEAISYRALFPNNYLYRWTHDVYGPIVIPQRGATVTLDYTNVWLYKRIIEAYENNKLLINDFGIYINGKPAKNYTFKMNYYFVMGDNRPNSIDSMFWGFVPEDHIIGKAIMILFSYGEKEDGGKGIRWNRIFKVTN